MSSQYIVYSDGACAPTNPGPAAWGAVILSETAKIRRFYGFLGPGTNQSAEISAAINGLKQTPEGCDVLLISDSQYTLKGLKEWRAGWIRRGWKNAAGEPVANKALWVELFRVADERNVTTKWVKGHNGDKFNEQADKLAAMGLLDREIGGVVEYRPAGQNVAPAAFSVGDRVRLASTEEAGIIVYIWEESEGRQQAYITFFGSEDFPTGKPDLKPYTLRYDLSALVKA